MIFIESKAVIISAPYDRKKTDIQQTKYEFGGIGYLLVIHHIFPISDTNSSVVLSTYVLPSTILQGGQNNHMFQDYCSNQNPSINHA